MAVIFNEKIKCKNCSKEFDFLCYFLKDGEFINLLRKNELQNTQYAWICEKIKKSGKLIIKKGLDDKNEK